MPQELQVNPSTRFDEVGRTGIYPASGPLPRGDAPIRGQGELAHPEERGKHLRLASWPGNKPMLAIGRAIFGGYFLYSGISHFLNRPMMAQYARAKNVPAADAAVIGSGALIVLGGLSLLTGTRPKVGASLIAAFLIAVTPQMHAFWKMEDEGERMQDFVNFTKNLALIGGAALAAAIPEPWPASVASRSGPLATA
jgi:putative oxidoreductase